MDLSGSSVEELDFALHAHLATAHEAKLSDKRIARLATGFDKVRILDLTRNEPGYLDPVSLGGGEDIYAIARDLPWIARLDELRVPRPATDAQKASFAELRLRHPSLRIV